MRERKRLLKLEDILEISLVDRPAQKPARVALTKRAALADVENLGDSLNRLESPLESLDLEVLKAEAMVEEVQAMTKPEDVCRTIEVLAKSTRRPDETKEQAFVRVLDEHPELQAQYYIATHPPVRKRHAYAQALALRELQPVVDALVESGLSESEALEKAMAVWPEWRTRYDALVEAATTTPVEKLADGHETRVALAKALVESARSQVRKGEGVTLEVALREAFARPGAQVLR